MFGRPRGAPTVIGAGATFEGSLRLQGSLQVDGRVEGEVLVEGTVSVGPDGVVVGEIRADQVAIAGRVEARVFAKGHLHMLPSGTLQGEATYQSLQVDRGGVIKGHTAPGEGAPLPAALPEGPGETGA